MRYLILFFSLFLLNCKTSKEIKNIDNSVFFTENTIISAHRAGKGIEGFPENCLETMEFLSKKGINNFEIDIFETSDGEILLFHDDNLGRTATGEGAVSKKPAENLKKEYLIDDFGTKTAYKMPYFEEVLRWSKKNNAFLMVDFKKNISFEKAIKLIRKEKMQNQVVLISYSVKQAQALHRLAPEMLLSVTARNNQELDWILETNIPTHKMVAFTGTRLSDESLFKRLKELKIPAILGTLGNLDRQAEARGDHLYREWANMGIQIFSTDRPFIKF